jgi:hypothetical protein
LRLTDLGIVVPAHDPDIRAVVVVYVEDLDIVRAEIMVVGNVAAPIRYPWNQSKKSV